GNKTEDSDTERGQCGDKTNGSWERESGRGPSACEAGLGGLKSLRHLHFFGGLVRRASASSATRARRQNTTSGPREMVCKTIIRPFESDPRLQNLAVATAWVGFCTNRVVVLELKDGVGEKERPNNAHNRA